MAQPQQTPTATHRDLDLDLARELAQQMRVDSIRCTTQAGSGHPTSSLSAADLMAVLLAGPYRYDFGHPGKPTNDRLIFSKGHASPLLYAMYRAAGAISDGELMSLRKKGSRLEGHPVPVTLPWVDVATGSLGQGLPYGVGVALAGKYLDHLPYRVWVLCGDSEMAEGSMWEAFEHASHYRLSNLVAIIDMNRLGQRGETMPGWNSALYAARARAFGWHVVEIDGHDIRQIDAAYREAVEPREQPTCIVARTEKGHGVSFLANREGWHGKPLPAEQARQAIAELGGERSLVVKPLPPADGSPPTPACRPLQLPRYDKPVATRHAYGDALKALGDARGDVVALDGEVSNSTYAEFFARAHPDRYFEMWIAEQQMVAAAVGIAVRGYVAFASSFAAFLSRAYDFIRMSAVSRADLRLSGSHAGVSIGEDGPSQMALEDLAMMRAVHGSTVLYPSDGTSAAVLTSEMARCRGISYIRTTREKTPILYGPEESFPIGGSKVLRRSDQDLATVVAAGITLHEALAAHQQLQAEGLLIRVIDLYSVKPVDRETLSLAARETGAIITVEDHWPEGGLGDAVLEALASTGQVMPRVIKLAVQGLPGSATPAELLDAAGISARHVVDAVKSLTKT